MACFPRQPCNSIDKNRAFVFGSSDLYFLFWRRHSRLKKRSISLLFADMPGTAQLCQASLGLSQVPDPGQVKDAVNRVIRVRSILVVVQCHISLMPFPAAYYGNSLNNVSLSKRKRTGIISRIVAPTVNAGYKLMPLVSLQGEHLKWP